MNDLPIQSLPAQQLHCWQPQQSRLKLRVLSGRLWLTQSGDARDHFLDPGDELMLTGQRVVIEAQSDARYVLASAQTDLAKHRLLPAWLVLGLQRHSSGVNHPAHRHPNSTE